MHLLNPGLFNDNIKVSRVGPQKYYADSRMGVMTGVILKMERPVCCLFERRV